MMLKYEDYGGKEETERPMRGSKESPASRILVQPAPLICSKILWCSKGEEYKDLIKRLVTYSAWKVRYLIENKGGLSRKQRGT